MHFVVVLAMVLVGALLLFESHGGGFSKLPPVSAAGGFLAEMDTLLCVHVPGTCPVGGNEEVGTT